MKCTNEFHYSMDHELTFCSITNDVCPGNCSYFDDALEDIPSEDEIKLEVKFENVGMDNRRSVIGPPLRRRVLAGKHNSTKTDK